MVSSKVKNLILLVLLIVNLFLLAPVVADAAAKSSARREAISETVEIVERRGIDVAVGADLSSKSLEVCSVRRDLGKEKKLASAILGSVEADDQGGNIIRYTGEKGVAVFRGSGDFEVLFNDGAVPAGAGEEKTARDYASKLGLNVLTGAGSAEVTHQGDSVSIALTCTQRGVMVRNCVITFTFNGGHLLLITGTRPLDNVSRDAQAATLDVPTVLMRFIETIESEGQVCSEVSGIEMCYSLSSLTSGTGTLVPVWRIVTDTGEIYINGMTGQQA